MFPLPNLLIEQREKEEDCLYWPEGKHNATMPLLFAASMHACITWEAACSETVHFCVMQEEASEAHSQSSFGG